METHQLITLVEANLEDLMNLRPQLNTADPQSIESIYAKVLYHFLKNEVTELEAMMNSLDMTALPESLAQLIHLRLKYRMQTLSLTETENLYHKIFESHPDMWKAESLFVLALNFQRHQSYVQAERCFEAASLTYRLNGALKKSLRCWGNAIAALSCHHPESFLIQEYRALYQKAFELEEWPSCAGALVNLSREYQRMGALSLAFEKAKEAEQIAERHLFFSREHHLSLLQKSHLLFCLNRIYELEQILPVLVNSTYADVKDSAQVLLAKMNNEKIISTGNVLPTWAERAADDREFDTKNDTDSLEGELIRVLSEGSKSKEELVTHLYGDKIDYLTLENRFKNVLSRARKKLPGRIIFSSGKYELVDISYQGKMKL